MTYSISRIAKLVIFYSIFYTFLGLYTTLIFKLFLNTLDDKTPKRQYGHSLIGSSPGLTFRPQVYRNVIEYHAGDPISSQNWNLALNDFLEPYLTATRHSNVEGCYFGQQAAPNKTCDFKIAADFAPCIPQYGYGFDYDGSGPGPCIFLKLNKVFGWKPHFYTSETAPAEMPLELFQLVKEAEKQKKNDKIWVDCQGVDSSDAEKLGSVAYYPQRGFSGHFFPFLNVEGYLSPLVAVHFEKPQRGVLIRVECRVWAANIEHHRGVVRLGLLIH